MPSLKKNFVYTTILTVAQYLFPLITYPYVSRVLGVENLGLCNFVDSFISYFCLISSMGISVLGIREVAKSRNNKESLSSTFRDLMSFNGLMTAIMLIALIICMFAVPKLAAHKDLMCVGAVKLVFNYFVIEWFYKGLEQFQYITMRSILIRALYVISIFIFVRKSSDYVIYYILTVGIIVANGLINLIHTRKYISGYTRKPNLLRFSKPFFTLGIFLLLTTTYTTLNVMILGLLTNDTQVGYYSTAIKIFTMLNALYTAFTGVMMPKMSSLFHEQKIDEFKSYIAKSLGVLQSISLPIMIVSTIMAPQLVLLISGPGYEGANTPMRIMMPFLLMMGYEQILTIQILMAQGQDAIVTRNALIAAVVSIIANLILIPIWQATGAALVWVTSEFIIFLLSIIAVQKLHHLNWQFKALFRKIIIYIPMIAALIVLQFVELSYIATLVVAVAIAIPYFLAVELLTDKNNPVGKLLLKYIKISSNKNQ